MFDYNDPDCAWQIYQYTQGELKLVWDTVGSEQGIRLCMEALSTRPGCRYGTILLNDIPRKDVICTSTILMTFLGEDFDLFGKHFLASQKDFEFAKKFTELTGRLLAENKLKPHPTRLGERGLEGALDGVKLMNEGKVSGEKLVYRVADTALKKCVCHCLQPNGK